VIPVGSKKNQGLFIWPEKDTDSSFWWRNVHPMICRVEN